MRRWTGTRWRDYLPGETVPDEAPLLDFERMLTGVQFTAQLQGAVHYPPASEAIRPSVSLAGVSSHPEREWTLPYATPIDGSAPACVLEQPDGSYKTAREMLDDAKEKA